MLTDAAAQAAPESTQVHSEGNDSPSQGNVDQQASQAGSWQDSLPESIRDWDEVKNSDSPEKFWDQVSNLRSMMGRSIRIPTEDAGEDVRNAFMQKIMEVEGVMATPDTAEGWVETISSLGEDVQRALYQQLTGMDTFRDENVRQLQDDMDAKIAEGLDKLRQEWGNGFDRQVSTAKNAVKVLDQALGGNRLVKALDETGAGNHPEMIAAFAKIGEMLGERPVIDGVGVNTFAITPAEAKERIAEIEANPAYWDASHPESKILRDKRSKYYEIVYPTED